MPLPVLPVYYYSRRAQRQRAKIESTKRSWAARQLTRWHYPRASKSSMALVTWASVRTTANVAGASQDARHWVDAFRKVLMNAIMWPVAFRQKGASDIFGVSLRHRQYRRQCVQVFGCSYISLFPRLISYYLHLAWIHIEFIFFCNRRWNNFCACVFRLASRHITKLKCRYSTALNTVC